MSEEMIDTPVAETPVAETPVEEASNLPSDNVEPSFDGFQITDELKAKFKDGKLNGRFESIDDVLTTLKNMEDKYANLNRELSDAEKAQVNEVQQTQEQLQTEQARKDTITELVPSFLENGMQLTEEMTAKLTEVGLTEAEIKLGAYELKDTLAKHHTILGGEEQYMKVMDYHAQNMSDAEKIAFNRDIQSGNHSEALLLGLQTMYEKGRGQVDAPNTDRVRGDVPASNTVRGYQTKAELFADKRVADTSRSPNDMARYKAKLALTDPKVYS